MHISDFCKAVLPWLILTLSSCSPPDENSSDLDKITYNDAPLADDAAFEHKVDVSTLKLSKPRKLPDGCKPISAPQTIRKSGHYCLTQDIIVSGQDSHGIVIRANNVAIDLRGFTIHSTHPFSKGMGVNLHKRKNARIYNGKISGFLVGIWLRQAKNTHIYSTILSGNTWRGVLADGKDIKVSGNLIRKLKGYRPYKDSPPIAIEVQAENCSISHNAFGRVKPINWNDITGIYAPKCEIFDNVDEGLPGEFCLPVRRATTINKPGSYCLKNDITITQPHQGAINFVADDIDFDLGGHTIRGPGGDTLGSGVRAEKFSRIEVSNGKIEGFLFGVRLEDGSDFNVNHTDIRNVSLIGIRAIGNNVTIIGNTISGIAGLGNDYASSHSFGIQTGGDDILISSNTVSNIMPYREGEGVGLATIYGGRNIVYKDNTISWDERPRYGKTFAFWNALKPSQIDETVEAAAAIPDIRIINTLIDGADYAYGGARASYGENNSGNLKCGAWTGNLSMDVWDNFKFDECPLSQAQLIADAQAYPDDLAMQYRLADKYMSERSFKEGVKIFRETCKRGFSEACRRMKRYEETGRKFD